MTIRRMLYGGNAHVNSGALGPECDFMFPFDSDPCNWGTGGIPPNGGFKPKWNILDRRNCKQ